ncbi:MULTISPECIES: GNAT family N-acetyltransferase [Flavobacterium]|uniref:Acetyltransferase (GNAT) family protein n=2 Tax=Flavobacterium TaxID=237 RepID=A0A2N9PAH0_9FLAO|nr:MULTISPECIES: GNAT family N-acetyltransferase [Flavobacterium]QYS88567.1 GNAT family N-acetyltransferase [Flavobacterium davisii]RVU92002.1 GNAT family N-acetyltransferase [Flavobacterium columnare]SPE77360.1 Acetyltransferase (GNAT) family protein [Flavobacterium columnare]
MDIKIISYDSKYKEDFIRLNKAWLEEYFYIEPHDIATFENIERDIIEKDGTIFFCLVNNQVVGTVAMIKTDPITYELAKMAVDKNFQGMKLSSSLMRTCIDYAISQKAKKIFLLSSTKLIPALNLYRNFNFIEVPLEETDYTRADIQMELNL